MISLYLLDFYCHFVDRKINLIKRNNYDVLSIIVLFLLKQVRLFHSYQQQQISFSHLAINLPTIFIFLFHFFYNNI